MKSGLKMATVARFFQERFLLLLLACYLLACLLPRPGLLVRNLSLGAVSFGGSRVVISSSMMLLAVLLVNASLSVARPSAMFTSPRLLAAGLTANLFLPALFLLPVSMMLTHWGGADNLQSIIVALALVSAVPVAGASTAYTQNAEGDLSLAVGLVMVSTVLSPLLMPLSLNLVNFSAEGDYTAAMEGLKGGASVLALLFSVVIPSVAGLLLRPVIGGGRIDSAKPLLKILNSCSLLLLNYSNASAVFPRVFGSPDWSFLGLVFLFTPCLCLIDFATGWWLGSRLGNSRPKSLAMMFGVGLNNNSSALVLAAPVFAERPKFLVPIILYGLIQHLIAGGSAIVVDPVRREPDQASGQGVS
jgi:BASS family bile acid:Na+ symporter